jgi:tetratricopeptide (TPR) repeat protein
MSMPVTPAPAPAPTAQPAAPPKKVESVVVPVGVDTSVAVSATLAAREVLVGYKEDSLARAFRKQADEQYAQGEPLLNAFRLSRQAPQAISPGDSLAGDEFGLKGDQASERAAKALGKVSSPREANEANRLKAAPFLESARDNYEHALQLNPWDAYSRGSLIQTYLDIAEIHLTLNDYNAAIRAIQKWLQLQGDDDYMIYEMGECYAHVGDSLHALVAFRQAEDRLLTWLRVPRGARMDTVILNLSEQNKQDWIRYVNQQFLCEASLGLSESALNDLERLVAVCEMVGDTSSLRNARSNLDALAWGSGNMEALHLRDRFSQEVANGNLEDARKILSQLLSILEAPTAILETRIWASKLDIRLGEYERGLTEMRKMLNEQGFAEVDSSLDSLLTHFGREGFLQHIENQKNKSSKQVADLVDTYGNACLIYGREVEDKRNDRLRAYVYYYQSALIPWKRQATALYYLADLSRNQPDRAIRYGEAALASPSEAGLTTDDRQKLYALLVNCYRNLKDKPRAEYYHKLVMDLAATGGKP